MVARATPKFQKINGFNIKYRSIVCLQLFGVYVGIISFHLSPSIGCCVRLLLHFLSFVSQNRLLCPPPPALSSFTSFHLSPKIGCRVHLLWPYSPSFHFLSVVSQHVPFISFHLCPVAVSASSGLVFLRVLLSGFQHQWLCPPPVLFFFNPFITLFFCLPTTGCSCVGLFVRWALFMSLHVSPTGLILSDLSSSSCLYKCVSSAHLFLCSLCQNDCVWFRGHSLLFKKDWRKIDRLISEDCNLLEKQRLFGAYAGVICNIIS